MGSKSDVKTMLREAGILFVITLAAGLLLGVVYELTREPIRIQQEKAVQEACAAAFPASGESGGPAYVFQPVDYELDADFLARLAQNGVEIGSVYLAVSDGGQDGGGLLADCEGYVVEAVSSEGYGGDIVLYVGVDLDGTVKGVSILELSETAGLGMEAPKTLVPQFAGKQVESFVYTKSGASADNEVDAITSATVTTSAVVNAVNGGLETARYLTEDPGRITGLKGGEGDE